MGVLRRRISVRRCCLFAVEAPSVSGGCVSRLLKSTGHSSPKKLASGPALGSGVPSSLSRSHWAGADFKFLWNSWTEWKLGRYVIKEAKKERNTKTGLISEGVYKQRGLDKLLPYLRFCKISSRISISYQLLLSLWDMVSFLHAFFFFFNPLAIFFLGTVV